MKILDSKTIVVSTSDELKNILEEENSYSYIYLDSDITLTEGITINQYKNRIIIDGTYLNVIHTLTGVNSNELTDTISVGNTEGKYTFKNLNIVESNMYGIIYIPSDSIYTNLTTEFINIKFNGVELSFNPYGIVIIQDSNITIERINGRIAREVCDANKVEIGGNTTIYSTTVYTTLFYYLDNAPDPSMTFLPNSKVNITATNKELMNGTTKLNFYVLHDAEVNITTYNGFASSSGHGVNNVLIDERATLNFLEISHLRIPMWTIYGTLTINEKANLSIINTYDNTPSDNYNIYFKGDSCKIILNNPNSFVIYTKNSNVIYTDNPIDFSFNISRANFWTDSSDILVAGSVTDLPEYSFFKIDDLTKINGTITNTETTITYNNFTEEELTKLPDISNFSFINKKQFSIGCSYLNIYPVDNSSNSITGYTKPFSDILVKYNDEEFITQSDSDGLFIHTITTPITDNTEIKIIACAPTSFIYEERIFSTPHIGELTLIKCDNNFPFELTPINLNPVILPTKNSTTLIIVDSRKISSNWKLYIKLIDSMKSKNNNILNNSVIFKKLDDNIISLTENDEHIFTGEANDGSPKITNLTYSTNKGILLSLENNALEINTEYNAKVQWSIKE